MTRKLGTQPTLQLDFELAAGIQSEPPSSFELAPRRTKDPHLVWLVGAGRSAPKVIRCRPCGAWVIDGWTVEPCSVHVTCDPAPLTPMGEALAWLSNRNCWTLKRNTKKAYIEWRNASTIKTLPAGGGIGEFLQHRKYDVIADHVCHQPLPATESAHKEHARKDIDDTTPF